MKLLKLFMDTRPDEQPESTYPFAKNGIQADLLGTTFNEPGFTLRSNQIPYTVMGVIETDDKPVIFSTDNTNSAIGYYNPHTNGFELQVCDDPGNLVNWPATGERLGFNTGHYITGQSQRNYKGELVIGFTDKTTFPKYLNLDAPAITRLEDLNLFPFYREPNCTLTLTSGGSLEPGSYYVFINYERNDGTITGHSSVLGLLAIPPGLLPGATDQAIEILLTNVDEAYDFIRVTIVSKIGGKTRAQQLADTFPVSGTQVTILYTGDNFTEEVSLSDVLVPAVRYDRVDCMGQLNDVLYLGGVREEPALDDLQPYALKVQLRWKSELIDVTNPPTEHKRGAKRSFLHEEAYAFYIRYKKVSGGYTKAFIIPGVPVLPDDLMNSLEPQLAGDTIDTAPVFKVEDRIRGVDLLTKTGLFGPYQNTTETYPDTADFDATFLAGPNLRNQPVRHHKVPSLRWCRANLYPGNPDYGRTHLDLIGVYATGVQIPSKYQGILEGYEILYAKRSGGNMTVLGQSLLMHPGVERGRLAMSSYTAPLFSTGGNWSAEVYHQSSGSYNDSHEITELRGDTFRMHPFDLLFSKPTITPRYLSGQYKLVRSNLRAEGYVENGHISDDYDGPQTLLVDYTRGETPTPVGTGQLLKRIRNSYYLTLGTTVDTQNNVNHETCYAGKLEHGPTTNDWWIYVPMLGYRIRGQGYTEEGLAPDLEQSFLANLLTVVSNIYAPFYSQSLVSAGTQQALTASQPVWGGDTFLVDYTYHTYGRHDSEDINGDGIRGIKVIRRVICESAANLHLRYEIPGNPYSKWYPKETFGFNAEDCYATFFERSKEPNQVGYNRDLAALNDLISSTIFNPFLEQIREHPYRIHRGGKISRQNKFRSWRSFLPLDYFECQKNMGRIINIESFMDRLLIHHENALFRTQDKAKLDAGVLSVTLGTGDIFQFEPQEASPSKLGYAGTQHDLACVKTPVGYVFPDARTGELFLLTDQLTNLNEGINTFLREYLKVVGRNVYTGNGITIGWDQKYKRLLLSAKNTRPTGPVKVFDDSDAFFNSLTPGDIVLLKGEYVEYIGTNNPAVTGLSCSPDTASPPVFTWVAGAFGCETNDGFTPVATLEKLGSPAAALWDTDGFLIVDYDNPTGNFYFMPWPEDSPTIASLPGQKVFSVLTHNQKLYATTSLAGLQIFHAGARTLTGVAYGTNGESRKGLWLLGTLLWARDIATNSFTRINPDTEVVADVLSISSRAAAGTYLSQEFDLNAFGSEVWVTQLRGGTSDIAVYNADLSAVLATISLPLTYASAAYSGFYAQTSFGDPAGSLFFVLDKGSTRLFVINRTTRTILAQHKLTPIPVDSVAEVRFAMHPVQNGVLLLTIDIKDSSNYDVNNRVYLLSLSTGEILGLVPNFKLNLPLVREGNTNYFWSLDPGRRVEDVPNTNYDTDGSLTQYL